MSTRIIDSRPVWFVWHFVVPVPLSIALALYTGAYASNLSAFAMTLLWIPLSTGPIAIWDLLVYVDRRNKLRAMRSLAEGIRRYEDEVGPLPSSLRYGEALETLRTVYDLSPKTQEGGLNQAFPDWESVRESFEYVHSGVTVSGYSQPRILLAEKRQSSWEKRAVLLSDGSFYWILFRGVEPGQWNKFSWPEGTRSWRISIRLETRREFGGTGTAPATL